MTLRKSNRSAEITEHNRVKLLHAGKEFFDALLGMIRSAGESIHLQFYILDEDETGRLVADALKDAARRKVDVYVVADGYASQGLSRKFISELEAAGVHFRFFEPLFRSKYFYFGRRLHQKVVVVDTRYALVGGVNISNRYNDMPDQPAWLDFAIWVEGEVARELCILCWKTWKAFPVRMGITPCEKATVSLHIPPEDRCRLRMRRNDWVRRKNQISRTYLALLSGAKADVVILSSYFLPGRLMYASLLRAVRRGVRVRVIVAGQSDVMIAKRAERWFYSRLLNRGIELYEYQKKILHGKLAVADDQWMTIGSYNVNNISAYASIELNLDLIDERQSRLTREMLEGIMATDCIRITPEWYQHYNHGWRQFTNWVSYQLIRVLFFVFTFYFREKP